MSGIYWLASYPKSGNTWLRIFLGNLRSKSGDAVDINNLKKLSIASARAPFDDALGIEASDLTHEEIDALRPDVYEYLASMESEDLFLKVHDAFTMVNGRAMLGGPSIRGAIYIVRNPLDVAVSLSAHIGQDLDNSISRMSDSAYAFCGQLAGLPGQLRQRLYGWSDHVLSWVNAPGIRLHVMRYEDMKSRSEEIFTAAAAFLGLSADRERIRKALARSDLGEMRRLERQHGFKERSPHAKIFFGQGQVGGYRDVLTQDQISAIVRAHGPVMRRFGYVGENGQPTL